MTESVLGKRFITGASELAQGAAETMAIPLRDAGADPLVAAKPEGAVPPGELIEPGRALAITDFEAPQISAGERLMRLAYKLGVPGQALVAPFRKPARPRLLATVASPVMGEPVAGTALRAGHFLVYGVKLPIAQVDFSPAARLTPPVERTVHGFTWMRYL